ncbi:MAG: hypothetical protein K2N29_00135 [Ruminiclostridium sp.]|nr:hypothetical protein [Ruminiclostridium sp.]
MIIDPKLDRMFRQCHEHKQQLDRQRRWVRAAMFCPPVLIALGCFAAMVLQVVNGLFRTMVGGSSGPDFPVLAFFVAIILGLFAAGETLIENSFLIEVSAKFYTIAAIVCTGLSAVSLTLRTASGALLLGLALYCVIALLMNMVFKRLYAENEMLRSLKGYPHFNPLLMSDAELREEGTPDRKPLEELTPDERLMRERDMNL